MFSIKKNRQLTAFISAFIFLPSLLFAQLTVKTDRPTAKYALGETATFIVTQANDGPANYSIKYAQSSDLPALRTGTVQISGGKGYISYNATEAGFVHCVVTQFGQTNYAGAAFDPFKIQPIEEEPVAFDAYWNTQKAALSAVPLSPNIYYRSETQYVTAYNYDIGLTDGKRAYGYINVPKGNGSYPAVIQMPPYGNSPNLVSDDGSLAERGGVISVYLNIHNNQPSQSGPNAYLDINLTDSINYYLKYAILGVIRTIDYLQTRPDFNGQMGIIGVSQGGGLAILAAGIDNRISLLVNAYPALCAHPNLKYNKPSGFPSYWKIAQIAQLQPDTVLKTVKYYDAVTAAKRFKGVSWSMIAYRDDICFPATSFEAYNQLKGQKILTHLIQNTHFTNPEEFITASFPVGMYALLRRHFPNANNPPFPYVTKTLGYAIDAGKDTVLTALNPITLKGTILLENNFVYYSSRWEKIGGVGNVTFENPYSLTTKVTFSEPGTYRLRLVAEESSNTANDNKYTTLSDDIVVTIEGAIPVELIDFKGAVVEKANLLTWSTASERNNKAFQLERSADGLNWELIAEIKGKGNSSSLNKYQYSDDFQDGFSNNFNYSIAYYRLKQIDENNAFNYSKTIALKRNKNVVINLFPNPINKELTIKLSESVGNFDIKIYDILGRVWFSKQLNQLDNTLNINDLPKGNYFIDIKNETFFIVKKFIKN
jgi:cephalosporin-C deacetylase